MGRISLRFAYIGLGAPQLLSNCCQICCQNCCDCLVLKKSVRKEALAKQNELGNSFG